MAKGNRSRSKKTAPKKKEVVKEKTIYDDFPAQTLSQDDANRMKEIFTLSNNVSALIRDYAEKAITVKNMRIMADKIEKKKQPLQIQVAKNMFMPEDDYMAVVKDIRTQSDVLEKSLVLIHGQIEHRYDDYVSTMVRFRAFVDKIIGGAENKTITGHRSTAPVKEQEEVLFEKEFDKLNDEDKLQLKKIDKEIKKAIRKKNESKKN